MLYEWDRDAKKAKITDSLFDLCFVLLYIRDMRQGTGHPVRRTEALLTGLVNPCTMDFVGGSCTMQQGRPTLLV